MADKAYFKKGIASDTLFLKLFDAFQLYICMCLSSELVNNALIGGAICLAGQVLSVYLRLFSEKNIFFLPKSIRAHGLLLLLIIGLLLVALLFLYPAVWGHKNFLIMLLAISILFFRQSAADILSKRLYARKILRILLLAAVHGVLSGALMMLSARYIAQGAYEEIASMVVATAVAALAYQAARAPAQQSSARPNVDKLRNVSSYRVYNHMVSSIAVSLNLALLTYICTTDMKKADTLTVLFWNMIVFVVLVGGVAALALVFFRRRDMSQYDKPSVFVVGVAMLAIALIGEYRQWFLGWGILPGYFLWGIGLALILSIILSMGFDMRAVLELDMKKEEYEGYAENTRIMIEWSLTLLLLLALIFLTLSAFVNEGADELKRLPIIRFFLQSMKYWPLPFLSAALIFALMQPLNKDYEKKLKRYHMQQRQQNVNPALEMRLQLKLVKQTRRILPSVLRAIIRPVMPCKVIGKEHVREEDGPVVFICNHLEIYGPLITNLHLPFYFRSWIISSMLDREQIAKQLTNGVNAVFHWLPKRMKKNLPGRIAPFVLRVLKSLDPIPVYRGSMREVITTMRLTVDAMEYEDNILLFPENPPDGEYEQRDVSSFYSGFAGIGAEYYKRTGLCTTFYPMYANKAKRTLTIGEGIRYTPTNGAKAEKARIVAALHAWMSDEAEE